MRNILVILFLFISLIVNSQNKNYYVSNSGDDGNDGESPAQAWKTIRQLISVTFQADDSVFFNRGDKWVLSIYSDTTLRVSGDGTAGHPVVITSYGTGAKPIITSRDTVVGWSGASNWSRPWAATRPNVWYQEEIRTPAYWTAYRMWFDSVEVERPQTFPPTAAKPWYWSGDDSLFIYSETNPATTFTYIEKATSSYSGIYLNGVNYVTINNLDIEHAYIGVIVDDADGIVIDSCDIKGFYGINAYASVDTRDVEIKNCNFDTENTFVSDWEAKYTGDGIKVGGISNTWSIHDNYFKNWGHTSIVLESTDADRIDNVKVYDNEITAPDVDYGGWLGVLYTNGDGNEIYRNYIHNIQTRMQVQGENLKFYYNIIDTVNAPAHYPKNINAGSGLWIGGLTPGTANNMKFYNNIIAHCEDYGIGLIHGATYTDKHDNEFINNIIYACDDTAIYVSSGATVLDNVFKNNLIYTSGATNIIYYRGTPNISVATWNSADISGDIIEDNIQDAPMFQAGSYELQSFSPTIDTGIDVGLTSDYGQKEVPWEGTEVDIGAYEYYGTPTTGNKVFATPDAIRTRFMKTTDGKFIIIIQ
jgi:hypothetical protein